MYSLWIFSGVFAATSSMSTPPSALTISTRRLRGAIDEHAEIELALDRQPFLDQQPPTTWPLGPVWYVTSVLPSRSRGDALRLVGTLDDLDAAGLAAAAGVDLRLDDDRAAAQAPGDVAGFLRA